MIAVEKGQEARLGAGGALGAAEAERRQTMLDLVEVEDEIIAPQAGALAHGGQLGRLEVGEAERRQVAPADGEPRQGVDDADQPVAQHRQPLAHQYQVGIVGDEAAGGAEVEDGAGAGGGLAVGVDVGHHVMAQPALVEVGAGEVDVVGVGAQLGQLGVGDARRHAVVGGQTEFLLRLGQGDPETAPGGELALRPPQLGHLPAGVAGDERVVVDRMRIHRRILCM